ncbi:WD40 repeat-like protein [Laetiporus sulphureus 93-53]|uniref:WD40 repeat-like protein n=1 Tax=Laetiporus sulphureus 93-53 TaxID=1314785 RepID=A0A165BMY3_9APHY|nr:WD40 repeat-like protein [Laetiporus sulphureus 93-53]KZT01333.1 WD40 repeat-like protein [Laetiporus sulphureus 93-53]
MKNPRTPAVATSSNASDAGQISANKSKGDVSINPFLASRPSTSVSRVARNAPSPRKRKSTGSFPAFESLQRQAKAGVIRKGGVESRLDVVTCDYVPPKSGKKRSKSQPTVSFIRDTRDRFITTRDNIDEVAATLDMMSLKHQSASPGHTARLAAAAGVPLNRRVLAYHEPPPAASADPLLAQARELVRPLYARPGTLPSSTSTAKSRSRKIATQPERVLDAPGMVDDFYLNLVAWSTLNVVAVALAESTYLWRADTGDVVQLGEAPEGSYVAAVDFSNDGQFLGVGIGTGAVELWDVEMKTKLRTMTGHSSQVACLSWNQHTLTSGCGDGSIWHHDVRVPRHKVGELIGHQGEVCGLEWRSDGELLASGGNDNVVNVWDGRVGDVTPGTRSIARWTKRNHTAAVKAISWCPWQPSLLASGGGTNDATVHIWNTTTGARLHSLATPSQITSIQWSLHRKEFLTTHGYPTNAIMIHAYPSMERVVEIRDAHDSRVLWSALGPSGDLVCTGAGDENLKFWRVWEVPKVKRGKEAKNGSSSGTGSTNSGILSIR